LKANRNLSKKYSDKKKSSGIKRRFRVQKETRLRKAIAKGRHALNQVRGKSGRGGGGGGGAKKWGEITKRRGPRTRDKRGYEYVNEREPARNTNSERKVPCRLYR